MSDLSKPTFLFLTNPTDTLPYYTLTFPQFQTKLQKLPPEMVVLGVSIDNQPVGLIIGEIYNKDDPAQPPIAWIHSLFVQPSHRRQGLGRTLLRRIEQELQQRKCQEIRLNYLSSLKTLSLQKLLSREGWTSENTGIICYCSKTKVLNAPSPHLIDYIDRLTQKLPPDYSRYHPLLATVCRPRNPASQSRFAHPRRSHSTTSRQSLRYL
ncbi:GNAT family N-acetyltransferase [Spirulina sp. 06S082]|uniref:GNAT family N-acetyltransferase n=1 Tax=Spirulina sp. 06S082 TaxID=3110248 RepID=UPI002B1F1D99|nr:GNAT family N-acetyltransferase [Spirulina sp. 06S082]MEA5468230.1 GNAT family N-acetyltransferase [Spirulina sp. 06S082]